MLNEKDVKEIVHALNHLPAEKVEEARDFIEFLAARSAQREALDEAAEWSNFSLAQAMEGLEGEDSYAYTEADLKEQWQ